jgi:hypothetical protein
MATAPYVPGDSAVSLESTQHGLSVHQAVVLAVEPEGENWRVETTHGAELVGEDGQVRACYLCTPSWPRSSQDSVMDTWFYRRCPSESRSEAERSMVTNGGWGYEGRDPDHQRGCRPAQEARTDHPQMGEHGHRSAVLQDLPRKPLQAERGHGVVRRSPRRGIERTVTIRGHLQASRWEVAS